MPAAGGLDVAALPEQCVEIDAPVGPVFDQEEPRQQLALGIAQERRERQVLGTLDVDLQRIDLRDAGFADDCEERPGATFSPST